MVLGDLVRLDPRLSEQGRGTCVILGVAHPSAWRHTRGDKFGLGEVGVILESFNHGDDTVLHRILTPRGTVGWIHELQLERVP